MKPLAVVEPAADQIDDVRHGFGRLVRVRLELEGAFRRLHDDHRGGGGLLTGSAVAERKRHDNAAADRVSAH